MRRIFILVMAAMVFFASFSPVAARTDERLTEAIRLARQFFPQTEHFRIFRSSLEAEPDRVIFNLHWSGATSDPARHNPSSLFVAVDMNRRLVVAYRFEPATPRTGQTVGMPAIPQFGREHAERVAQELARRLAPTQFAAMRLSHVDEPAIRIGKRFWPHFYTFTYLHHVNGIPFAHNSLRVIVNADTGAVQEYALQWGDFTFPAPQGIISQTGLARVFGEVGLKLVYQRAQWWRPMQEQEKESEPFLAYVLEDGPVLQIDAFTGKVTYLQWHGRIPPSLGGLEAKGGDEEARTGLTPAELTEIEFVAGLLPLERAEIIAREIAALPASVILVNSQLLARQDGELRLWQLQFGSRESDRSVHAGVALNAVNGELLSLDYFDEEKQPVEPKLEQAEAERLAESFLRRFAPGKFARVRLVAPQESASPRELPHSYWFSYQRYENNIPVIHDQVHVSVRHDSRITNFGFNWYDGKFPSAVGVLTPAQMNALFLREQGLHLQYVLEYGQKDGALAAQSVVRLVYAPKQLSSYNFNAFTGKNIDHTGKEIVPLVKPVYRDIAGHWAERDIRQLVDLGLLRLEGPDLRPDAVLTVGEFLRLLTDASGYSGDADEQLRSFAWQSGIMPELEAEKADLNRPLTRELMAFYLARHQWHGQTAALRGIWSAPFADFSAVAPEYQGSVAIVHALGLMRGDTNSNFLPRQQTTRAQAIVIIARMLTMQ